MADPQAPSVPVMFGDGASADVRMVPMSDLQGAVQQGGGRIAHKMVGSDGDARWIPQEDVADAMKSGMQHYGAMVPRRPMDTTPSLGEQIDSGLQDAGNKLIGMVKPSGGTSPLSQLFAQVSHGMRVVQGVVSQPTAISKAGAVLAPLVGVDATGVQQAAQQAGKTGNYGPLASNFVVPPAIAVAMGRAGGVNKVGPQVDAAPIVDELAAGEVPPKAPITDAGAAQRITDAVNPAPKQMARFQANVEKQMPNIREFVADKPKNPTDLLNAVTQAAEAKRTNYYQNIVEPHADVNLPAPSLFKGETTQPSSTTIGMLDKRLSDINAQLSGSYDKEGVSQVQALSGPEKLSLKAESAQIRDLMNNELGARTGMGADAVAKARADFGQLRDIQFKLQSAISRQRFYQNQQNQKPITPEDVTSAGLVRQGVKELGKKVLGSPQDRAIRKAF